LPPGLTNITPSTVPARILTTKSGAVTCTFSSLATNAVGTLTITAVPTASDLGLITNSVSVTSAQVEDNPVDNTASLVTAVNTPTADLAIGVNDAPNPATVGNNLVYSVSVTNFGPATAAGVIVTNTPPPGIVMISNTSAAGAVTNAGVVTFNLGNMSIGAVTNFTVIVQPLFPGTVLNSFDVGSTVPDPLKGDNFASVKTIVQNFAVPLSVTSSGGSLKFTWSTTSGINFTLQSTTNLTPPVVWQNVNGSGPLITGGTETVTVPIAPGSQFFRLSGH
jgi:uncharacterized repeat protein (TIGR01451 family)